MCSVSAVPSLQTTKTPRRRAGGYTLIEIMLVMGIIIMIIALVLISVNAMLRTSKMSRAVNLITASIDEARTAAITIRRTTRVDVTPLDSEGKFSRMTVFGAGVSDSFEEYNLPTVRDPNSPSIPSNLTQDPNLALAWHSTGQPPMLEVDGTRCLRATGLQGASVFWNPGLRVDAISLGDYYEAVLFARFKILPGTQRKDNRTMHVGVLCSIDDGGGSSVNSAYAMIMDIIPDRTNPGRNASSMASLNYFSGGSGQPLSPNGKYKDGVATLAFDSKNSGSGTSAPTALLVENVWYRVLLTVKSYTPTDSSSGSPEPRAILSGKIWADGQLEPANSTLGPITVTGGNILSNGFGGFSVDGCDVHFDDVLFDLRPIRLIPQGITMTALDPNGQPPYSASEQNSPYSFPLIFRPDGTTSVYSIIEIADSTTKNKRWVRIDQNTGRCRVADILDAVKSGK